MSNATRPVTIAVFFLPKPFNVLTGAALGTVTAILIALKYVLSTKTAQGQSQP